MGPIPKTSAVDRMTNTLSELDQKLDEYTAASRLRSKVMYWLGFVVGFLCGGLTVLIIWATLS